MLQNIWKGSNLEKKLILTKRAEHLNSPIVEHFNYKIIINFFDHL